MSKTLRYFNTSIILNLPSLSDENPHQVDHSVTYTLSENSKINNLFVILIVVKEIVKRFIIVKKLQQ